MENVSVLMGFSFLFIQPVMYLDPLKFALKTVEKYGFLREITNWKMTGFRPLLKLFRVIHLLPSVPLGFLSSTGKIQWKSITKLINGGQLMKLLGSPACLWAIHWVKRKDF